MGTTSTHLCELGHTSTTIDGTMVNSSGVGICSDNVFKVITLTISTLPNIF